MLLTKLNKQETEAFCAILMNAGEADRMLAGPEEISSYVRYTIELGIDSIDSRMSLDEAINYLAKNSSDMTLRSIFLETAIFLFCDFEFDPREATLLKKLASAFSIDDYMEMIDIAAELTSLYDRLFPIMGL